ncbi:MAG: hypothetical protein JWN02_266 [Acidobacteria bacterium]|nr:hypothetical protein [Acidobacteriota bacterium]
MNSRFRLKDLATIIRLGFLSLVLANVARRFLHANAQFSENLVDGFNGLLFGLAIGLLLLGVWRNGHRRMGCGPGAPPLA